MPEGTGTPQANAAVGDVPIGASRLRRAFLRAGGSPDIRKPNLKGTTMNRR